MIVADASAVLELLLNSVRGARVAARLSAVDETVHAPELLDVEVLQVLRRYARNREIEERRGAEAVRDLFDLPITRYRHAPLGERVWRLRNSLSAYDATYVALAEALDAPLLTCDARLVRSHGHGAKIELVR
ncbi:MAG TPA: type II toxin-antitoxin system VapC family toxin [Pseudomonadales bacterium]|nr:type II toxin-antitoxin system VapC family toxin [Pseudomonadales bacterium]